MTDSKGGPKTKQGKLAASRNSLKHGLLSAVLIFEEHDDQECFKQLRDAALRWARPQNRMEAIAADEIAVCYWKLRQVESRAQELQRDGAHSTGAPILDALVADERIDLSPSAKTILGADSGAYSSPYLCQEIHLHVLQGDQQHRDDRRNERQSFEIQNRSTDASLSHGTGRQNGFDVQLHLVHSQDRLHRYHVAASRELDRAIARLERLRELSS